MADEKNTAAAATQNEAAATATQAAPSAKAIKFKDLAEKRTAKALDAIANLGGLSAKNNYEYTAEQVEKITGAMTAEIERLKLRFANPAAKTENKFSL